MKVASLLLSGLLLASPAAAENRIARVGLLNPNSEFIGGVYVTAFRQEMMRLGYVEGQNVVIDVRYADGNPERLRPLAGELAQSGAKVLVAPSEPVLLAAKEAGRGLPDRDNYL